MANVSDLIGVPFQYGGRGPDTYDCYGLLRELMRRDGTVIPDYLSPTDAPRILAMFALGLSHWQQAPCKPGTALLIQAGTFAHCGYVLDSMWFAHTWEKSGGVVKERLDDWKHRIKGSYRYVG